MFSTRQRCGHCQQLADLALVFSSPYKVKDLNRKRGTMGMSFPAPESAHIVASYSVGMCPLCEEPSIVTYNCERRIAENIRDSIGKPETLIGGESLVKITSVFPKPVIPDDHAQWPVSARKLYTDAVLMLREGKSAAIVIATCRAILEASVNELEANGKNLKDKIDDLLARHVITQPLADWSHRVRLDGNAAIHELDGTETDASELLDFVRMFLDMCFALPKTIDAKSQESAQSPA